MSGRLAVPKRRNYRAIARVAFVALCGLACGLLVSPEAAIGRASAQPTQPTQPTDAKKVDQKNPVPADTPGRKAHAEFAVPDLGRLMFARIEDFKPVASQAENPHEYDAWCEVVSWAKKFEAADLERHAARDLSVVELVRVWGAIDPSDPTRPRQSPYRCDLLRFDGQLMYVRRLEAPLFFQNNPELGVKELYEARLVPVDESPLMPVSIVFLQLPDALAAVKDKPLVKGTSEWMEAKQYVSAAGYFFKTMNVPGQRANAVVGVPVLIGKSVTLLPGPPAPAGSDPTVIEPMRLFNFIKDETEMIHTAPNEVQWPEVAANNRVLIHANRFSAEKLEEHANPDVKFADLFLDVRTAYKLKLVKFEGRLISLRRMDVSKNDDLLAAGVENVFEGWLIPLNEPRGNPVCIVFTEPLAGVPTGRVNKWVSFAGYSFKKMRYESAEQDPKNPGKNVHKYAPLLIGKSPIPRPDPDGSTVVSWSSFVLWAIVGGALLIGAAGVLTWYYRGGDKKAKVAMDAVRNHNPFDANSPPPA